MSPGAGGALSAGGTTGDGSHPATGTGTGGAHAAADATADAPRPATRGAPVRPRLLVLRALGLGDLLTAVPALRGLRAAFRRHELVLAAPAALAPLTTLVGDVVDTVVDVDFRDCVGALPEALVQPDVAVNLHGRGPQSHAALAALAPGRLLAFADPAHAPGGPAWDGDDHERQRW